MDSLKDVPTFEVGEVVEIVSEDGERRWPCRIARFNASTIPLRPVPAETESGKISTRATVRLLSK